MLCSSSSWSYIQLLYDLLFSSNSLWKESRYTFIVAQCQMLIILCIAKYGNEYKPSYPRNENKNTTMFWYMNILLFMIAVFTIQKQKQKPISSSSKPSSSGSSMNKQQQQPPPSSTTTTTTSTSNNNTTSTSTSSSSTTTTTTTTLSPLLLRSQQQQQQQLQQQQLQQEQMKKQQQFQLLSRQQTEEWKGWMQWMFIMYHYYRVSSVYNEIRVFVSSYVWMTGFGNFLYFTTTKKNNNHNNKSSSPYTITRIVSMWLRINYFPLLLSYFVGVPLDLLYIVPLHTTAFFITMITCYIASSVIPTTIPLLYTRRSTTGNGSNSKKNSSSSITTSSTSNVTITFTDEHKQLISIILCFIVHIVFYETSAFVQLLETLFSYEIRYRFTSDRYSAVIGMLSAFMWKRLQNLCHWAYNGHNNHHHHHHSNAVTNNNSRSLEQIIVTWMIRIIGFGMIILWYISFGFIDDRYTYNPIHPYVFWIPMIGYLLIRNGSYYLTTIHSTVLEFFGKITLETYVLQFHIFMCNNVQHIPIVIPGSGPISEQDKLDMDSSEIRKHQFLQFFNMIFTGIIFVTVAYWARTVTVTTQTTITELLVLISKGGTGTTTTTAKLGQGGIEQQQQQQGKNNGSNNNNHDEQQQEEKQRLLVLPTGGGDNNNNNGTSSGGSGGGDDDDDVTTTTTTSRKRVGSVDTVVVVVNNDNNIDGQHSSSSSSNRVVTTMMKTGDV